MLRILPKARNSEIVEQDLGQELLIYDLRIDKAYTLNETSKIVFKACGTRCTFDELTRRQKFTDDLIYLALDGLRANNLIENYQSTHFAGLSRREIIKKVGLASMIALPVIVGMTAPMAANAASLLLANNAACTQPAAGNSQECASGNCVVTSGDPQLRCCVANGTIPTGEVYYLYLESDCSQPSRTGGFFCCSGRGIYTRTDGNGNGYCTCIS